jgi:hypothetical protein
MGLFIPLMPSSLSRSGECRRNASSGTEHQAGAFLREASSIGVSAEQSMFKQVFRLSALLIASVSIASAAGGGAGGAAGGGAHGSGGHGGNSFGKPAVENSTVRGLRARSPCTGAVAVIPTTGGPLPNGPPINDKSIANERTSCRRDRAEQPGPPSPDSAR